MGGKGGVAVSIIRASQHTCDHDATLRLIATLSVSVRPGAVIPFRIRCRVVKSPSRFCTFEGMEIRAPDCNELFAMRWLLFPLLWTLRYSAGRTLWFFTQQLCLGTCIHKQKKRTCTNCEDEMEPRNNSKQEAFTSVTNLFLSKTVQGTCSLFVMSTVIRKICKHALLILTSSNYESVECF